MNKSFEEQIYAIDPVFFRQQDLDMTQTCMCWGIECGDGWFEPIKRFVECVALLNKMCQPFGVAIVADQIKSKWADFTCYWNIVPLDEDDNSNNENDRQIDNIYHLMDAGKELFGFVIDGDIGDNLDEDDTWIEIFIDVYMRD